MSIRVLLFCICLVIPAAAAELPSDSSRVPLRIPSREALESLKTDKDFSYLYAVPDNDSWWANFWIWLGQQLTQVFQNGEGLGFWSFFLTRVIPWTIVLLAIALVTMKLLGIDPDSFLRKKTVSSNIPFREATAGLAHDDFKERMEEALGQRNFRLAIRLYYLDILRHLSGAGLIEWHPDKTNRQYFREISSKELRDRFGRLTRLFEYVWYGETSPGEADFEAARAEFHALKNSIGGQST
ncbi:DUF4129 domain-containing protein [Anseongella ginsenosidimutans]|uniref:DUF4129 domain-containing protein n=1 Tax=Anseongella ginsenosidimutans TaxID=496056 RepID=UPI0013159270|nr:DUF4129 domain-containing protein [Anseongella ginsenosidimutans]